MPRHGLSTDVQAHIRSVAYQVPEKEASPTHVHTGRAPRWSNTHTNAS